MGATIRTQLNKILLGYDGTLLVNPNVQAKVPFDPVKDLAPISKIGDAVPTSTSRMGNSGPSQCPA